MKKKKTILSGKSYTYGLKAAVICLQAVCVLAITVCVLTLGYWTDGTFRLSELGRPFEETTVFLNDVEEVVRRKISCARDEAFFETDGEENLDKGIDIRQYVSGVTDSANQNENTTYLLRDLINFYPRTGQLQAAVDRTQTSDNPSDASYDNLVTLASGLETILPASGNSLADTARLSGSPYTKLAEYYSALCTCSDDIYKRYQSYVKEHENPSGESHQEAPGNIRYFAENTTAKTWYTNLQARNCTQARSIVEKTDGLIFLFEGSRTMNIMVADTDRCLNSEAVSKFIDTVFLGPNERVLIAFEDSYPVGDSIHEDYISYQSREPIAIGSLVIGILAALMLAILVVIGLRMAGRSDRRTLMEENSFDRIPAEIAIGITLIVILAWYYLIKSARGYLPFFRPGYEKVYWSALVVGEYLLLYAALLSIARRHKHGDLASNTVFYTLLRVSRQVITARVTSRKLIVVWLLFIVANFFLLRFFGAAGIVIVLVMDLALLLYLLRDQIGKLSVRQGLREISKGKLDYKIDEHGLTGDSLEMARAVNEMGDGLQEAVASMVKNERLKAELITNVSHDLKTPLTSVVNYVDLLKRLNLKDERAREYIEVLDHKSQRLKSLITDLIDASKISTGNVELEMAPLDFRSMLLMAEGEFEERFEDCGLRVKMNLPRKAVMVVADGSQLYRVLDNLFSNLAKYAKPGTDALICMQEKDGLVEAEFTNTSKDYLDKSGDELLERFVRGDKSRSTSEGSGLGLSIAKNLTELMGGSFHVKAGGYQYSACVAFPAAGYGRAEEAKDRQ